MRLRVSNLISTVTKHVLIEIFEEFGEVDSVKIFRSPGASTCLCILEMPSERGALEAIEELNGEELEGLKMKVERSQDIISKKSPTPKPKPILLDEDEEEESIAIPFKKETVPDDFVAVEDAEEEEEFSYDKGELED